MDLQGLVRWLLPREVLLREREVLEHLESALDHCNHVANTLANLAAKNG